MSKYIELYNTNSKIKEYVDRFMKHHNVEKVEDAFKHCMVRNYVEYVTGGK